MLATMALGAMMTTVTMIRDELMTMMVMMVIGMMLPRMIRLTMMVELMVTMTMLAMAMVE